MTGDFAGVFEGHFYKLLISIGLLMKRFARRANAPAIRTIGQGDFWVGSFGGNEGRPSVSRIAFERRVSRIASERIESSHDGADRS